MRLVVQLTTRQTGISMTHYKLLPIILLCSLDLLADAPPPPEASQRPYEMTLHGDTRIDPYYWMKDRENPEVVAYLEAENRYAEAVMGPHEELMDTLFDEMVGRLDPSEESVPYELNGYWYYSRYEDGLDYPIYARKKGSLSAPEEIVIDVNALAEGTSFFSLRGLTISSDNQLAAFAVDTIGRRNYTIWFKDLQSGELTKSDIENVTANMVWAEGTRVLFYADKDPVTLRTHQIWRHEFGSTGPNTLVYEELDETFSCGISKTKSREFLVIGSYQTLASEFRTLPASEPEGEWQLFEPREREHEYAIDHANGRWVVWTNWQASNFRLMEVLGDDTRRSNWRELVPHRPDVMVTGFEVFQDYLVVSERRGGLPHIIVMPNEGESYPLTFPDATYSAWVSVNPEVATSTLRYSYSSMTTPSSTYDFNMANRTQVLKKRTKVSGGFNPENYQTQYLWAPARDGTEIPISLVYRKDQLDRGNNPTVLYAYGSYGSSSWATFSSARLSLLDRGFVWAIAHVRGGQELGRQWYEDGKLLNKKNSFTDFIDTARHLKKVGWSDPDRLYGYGGSAGGLLIGAAINMAPEVFHGVVAAVPFVDVVTTMLDASIPLTTFEWDEWGNPEDPAYYDYLLSYSPYDQVSEKDYPHLLVTAGLHDSQVQYWEPAKWVAKLRDVQTTNKKLLLYTNMEAGHGGASGRLSRQRETARNFTFFIGLAAQTSSAAASKQPRFTPVDTVNPGSD